MLLVLLSWVLFSQDGELVSHTSPTLLTAFAVPNAITSGTLMSLNISANSIGELALPKGWRCSPRRRGTSVYYGPDGEEREEAGEAGVWKGAA